MSKIFEVLCMQLNLIGSGILLVGIFKRGSINFLPSDVFISSIVVSVTLENALDVLMTLRWIYAPIHCAIVSSLACSFIFITQTSLMISAIDHLLVSVCLIYTKSRSRKYSLLLMGMLLGVIIGTHLTLGLIYRGHGMIPSGVPERFHCFFGLYLVSPRTAKVSAILGLTILIVIFFVWIITTVYCSYVINQRHRIRMILQFSDHSLATEFDSSWILTTESYMIKVRDCKEAVISISLLTWPLITLYIVNFLCNEFQIPYSYIIRYANFTCMTLYPWLYMMICTPLKRSLWNLVHIRWLATFKWTCNLLKTL